MWKGRTLAVGTIGLIIVASAMAHRALAASTVVTPLGWAATQTNGTLYQNDGQTQLPSSVGSTIDGQGIITVASASATARVVDSTKQASVNARFVGSFKISTTVPFPDYSRWTLVGKERVSADANGVLRVSGCSCQGTGASIASVASIARIPTLATPDPDGVDRTSGPIEIERSVPLSQLAWFADGSSRSTVAKIAFGVVSGLATATGLARGTNAFAASGYGSGGYSFYASGAKSDSSGGGALSISVPPNRFGVLVSIYDPTGNLVDTWDCDSGGGTTATLFVDDYAPGQYTLAFRAPGTLVAKLTVALDPARSQSVNPSWRYGDLDGDNLVSQDEVSFVSAHVGTVISTDPTSSDKIPAGNSPYAVAWADLDGDGTITQADVDLAQANLGAHGD